MSRSRPLMEISFPAIARRSASTRIDSTPKANAPESSNVLVYYQNVSGMNTYVDEYRLASSDCSYDVIALTETWLNERTSSNQVCGDYYEVFRCDRNHLNSSKVSGGGVLLAIRRAFQARELKDARWSIVEQVWVSIKLVDHTVFICVIYFPPD